VVCFFSHARAFLYRERPSSMIVWAGPTSAPQLYAAWDRSSSTKCPAEHCPFRVLRGSRGSHAVFDHPGGPRRRTLARIDGGRRRRTHP
jgi:hypothetical protein